jgi:hypothetical protein
MAYYLMLIKLQLRIALDALRTHWILGRRIWNGGVNFFTFQDKECAGGIYERIAA